MAVVIVATAGAANANSYLTLTDADCSQLTTGHSALCTMWLSAPVLAYYLLISDTEECAALFALRTLGVWHRSG
mgnify:CR=1 FL=1